MQSIGVVLDELVSPHVDVRSAAGIVSLIASWLEKNELAEDKMVRFLQLGGFVRTPRSNAAKARERRLGRI